MSKFRRIKKDEFVKLAASNPAAIGTYDSNDEKLTTPQGDLISLELGKVGRSKPEYISGNLKDFLESLELPELRKTEEVEGTTSLPGIHERQVVSTLFWGAWFRDHPTVKPSEICNVVNEGYAEAEAGILAEKEKETAARKQQQVEAKILKRLERMKNTIGGDKLSELLSRVQSKAKEAVIAES